MDFRINDDHFGYTKGIENVQLRAKELCEHYNFSIDVCVFSYSRLVGRYTSDE